MGLENHALPFQTGVLEVQDQSHLQLCDPKVIQHLTAFVVGDAINHLRVHDHQAESNQVGNELADFDAAKQNRKPSLLIERNPIQLETDGQRVLVNLFVQPVPDFVENLEGKSNYSLGLVLQDELRTPATAQVRSLIRVHPCPSVVKIISSNR